MVLVAGPQEMHAAYGRASLEAFQAFGDDRLFLERFLSSARHIEVQIMADRYGTVIAVGDRDCSVQRRYQKVVEEAPASLVSAPTRELLAEHAVALGSALGYEGAGTVEFLVDPAGAEHVFLEVNTRIQVEHPVTELTSGVDLVREQLRVAAGAPLSFDADTVRSTGHAIECRLNAEDADLGYRPSPGTVTEWVMPNGVDVRVDTHCHAGYTVTPYYDSMLAKIITRGATRSDALSAMKVALDEVHVGGVTTNLGLLQTVVAHPDFRSDRISTQWLETSGLTLPDQRRTA